MLNDHIRFNPDQMKSVWENEWDKFYFALILQPPDKIKVSESGIKWYKSLVPISMAGMKKIWLNSLAGCPKQINMTPYIDSYDTHMDQKLQSLVV